MVNGYFDVLEDQWFALAGLFFLLVLFKWLTVFSMCLIIRDLHWWDYFFLLVLSKWLTVISMGLIISGLHQWNYFFCRCCLNG
jgi:hypothetical protein